MTLVLAWLTPCGRALAGSTKPDKRKDIAAMRPVYCAQFGLDRRKHLGVFHTKQPGSCLRPGFGGPAGCAGCAYGRSTFSVLHRPFSIGLLPCPRLLALTHLILFWLSAALLPTILFSKMPLVLAWLAGFGYAMWAYSARDSGDLTVHWGFPVLYPVFAGIAFGDFLTRAA